MQLLKGTDILLYGSSTTEIINNVLIGEPSVDGRKYTLGIPKGDAHIWTDRKIGFFGRNFRTIGFPEQGIEVNIPLSWHKKVHVEQLENTVSCTVYEKDSFAKHVYYDVFYHDNRGEKDSRLGAEIVDNVLARIYSFSHDNSYIPKAGDIIVTGASDFEFDTSSQQAVSESMAQFRRNNEFAVIRTVSRKINGELPDIEITGR